MSESGCLAQSVHCAFQISTGPITITEAHCCKEINIFQLFSLASSFSIVLESDVFFLCVKNLIFFT